MRTRLPLIAVVLVGLLLAGAGAVYGYDRSRADVIADGVRVGGHVRPRAVVAVHRARAGQKEAQEEDRDDRDARAHDERR